MKTLKLASLAGMLTSVVMTQTELFSMLQPAATPRQTAPRSPTRNNPASPTTNPSTQNPPGTTTNQNNAPAANNPATPTTNPSSTTSSLPGTTNQQPATNNPGSPTTNPVTTGVPGTTTNGQPAATGATGAVNGTNGVNTANGAASNALAAQQRFFALSNPAAEAQLTQTGQKLARIEQQFATTNQQLLKQLGQARQMTGDRRFEAIGEVMQAMLQQQAALSNYLVDLRTSITGDLGTLDGNVAPQPGATPTFNPGTTQGTRLNPGSPTTNPATPRSNTQPNPTNSVPGENRLNPGTPTTNPTGPGGGGNGTGVPGATGTTGTTGTTNPPR